MMQLKLLHDAPTIHYYSWSILRDDFKQYKSLLSKKDTQSALRRILEKLYFHLDCSASRCYSSTIARRALYAIVFKNIILHSAKKTLRVLYGQQYSNCMYSQSIPNEAVSLRILPVEHSSVFFGEWRFIFLKAIAQSALRAIVLE